MLLYNELAPWWPLLSSPADYAEEAAFFARIFQEQGREVRTVLELGSGGGNNAFHLKQHFTLTLSDPAPGILAVSRELNPELPHHLGDMRTLRLGQTFDAVFVHDAICYMTSESDLRQALQTAYEHTRPGGLAYFGPDYLRESFAETCEQGGEDGPDGRSLRYLAWVKDEDPADTFYTTDYVYLLREPYADLRVLHDRHTEGLFPRATWEKLLAEVGFAPQAIFFEHSEVEPGEVVHFLGQKA
ncbi:MAG: hypothetical protein OHK0021_17220 [Bryobacter sp.]